MSTKSENSLLATQIAQLIKNDANAIKDGIKSFPFDALESAAEEFTQGILTESLTDKFWRNTAPNIPGDNPPAATSYPEREELKPTSLAVPDPAKTETATSTKISIPDYPELKRFSQAIGEAAKAASELFEIASDENWQKEQKRRDLFDWLDEARSASFDI